MIGRQGLIALGAAVTALGYSIFQVPFNITAGGLSGLAIIVNHFSGWPEGTMFFIMNLPLVILGFFQLGRWRFIFSVFLSLIVFSGFTDVFVYVLPKIMTEYPITDNILLSAIYAGIVFGIGNGLIFRAGGMFSGHHHSRPNHSEQNRGSAEPGVFIYRRVDYFDRRSCVWLGTCLACFDQSVFLRVCRRLSC